jgi:hypothetical protein
MAKAECPKFAGLRHDDSEDFLSTFDWYVIRKHIIDDHQKIAHLIAHLQDAAARWAKSLTYGPVIEIPPEPVLPANPNAQQQQDHAVALAARAAAVELAAEPNTVRTYDQFKAAFRRQYGRAGEDNWRDQAALWATQQKPEESVEAYISEMQRKATAAGVEAGQQKGLIINGLLPHIKAIVLIRDIDNVDQLRKWALVAQDIHKATASKADSDMKTEFRKLEAKIDDLKEIRTLSLNALAAQDKLAEKTNDGQRNAQQGQQQQNNNRPRGNYQRITGQQRGPPRQNYQQGYQYNQYQQQQQYGQQYEQPYGQQYEQPYGQQPNAQQMATVRNLQLNPALYQQPEGDYQRQPSGPQPMKRCYFCARVWDHGRQECIAWGKTCDNCGRMNHIRAACRQARAVAQQQA